MGSYPNFFIRNILAFTKSFSASVRVDRRSWGSWMLYDEWRIGDYMKSDAVILGTSDQEMGRECRRVGGSGSVLMRRTRLIINNIMYVMSGY